MWTDTIQRWTGLKYIEAARREQDRHDWRAVVSNPLKIEEGIISNRLLFRYDMVPLFIP